MDQDEIEDLVVQMNQTMGKFSLGLKPDLSRIANLYDISYTDGFKVLTMRHIGPSFTARVHATGKVIIFKCPEENNCRNAAQIIVGIISVIHDKAQFLNFEVVNINASCRLPFKINLQKFANANINLVRYHPELERFAILKLANETISVNVYSTGALVCISKTKDKINEGLLKAYEMVFMYQVVDE